ncbi:MAG: hypothetical protein ABS948_00820 [Solibacillus sp.]
MILYGYMKEGVFVKKRAVFVRKTRFFACIALTFLWLARLLELRRVMERIAKAVVDFGRNGMEFRLFCKK